MWYHIIMKKALLIFIALLMILLGCKGTAKDTKDNEAAPQSIQIKIAPLSPKPSAASQETPWPYPSDEDLFVPKATIQPTPEPTAAPTETPEPERYMVEDGVETVAWLSDTQHYANYHNNAKKNVSPDIYPAMTGFLRDKADEMHLVYVVHTGDLVHVNGDAKNWKNAREAMDLIRDIPTGVLAGNHDMAKKGGGYKNYGKYFGEKQYSQQTCYGESFENNRGHYDLVTICGREYIFVYMSYGEEGKNALQSKKAIQFIIKSFQKYPDRVGILCVHDFITTEGTLSAAGKQLRDQVVAKCPNIYLVLCGHRYGLYTLEDAFDDDGDGVKERTVYEIMMNYQAAGDMGGGGYLRLMQFDEAAHEIRCVNYSPYLNDYDWLDEPHPPEKDHRYEMDEKSESFTLKMPWA